MKRWEDLNEAERIECLRATCVFVTEAFTALGQTLEHMGGTMREWAETIRRGLDAKSEAERRRESTAKQRELRRWAGLKEFAGEASPVTKHGVLCTIRECDQCGRASKGDAAACEHCAAPFPAIVQAPGGDHVD